VQFEITEGESTQSIASRLEESDLIREDIVFRIYAKLNQQETLQFGVYEVSSGWDTPEIFEKLTSDDTVIRSIAIIPGFTLNRIQERLVNAGYEENAVSEALSGSYGTSVEQYIPPNASLEGFLYPDTYIAGIRQSPDEIIKLALSEMSDALTPDLIQQFKARNLSVFEAVTLASIVQQEISDPELQKQIAQVYLKRLQDDIRLDADPTFRYASELAGVRDDLFIDSPYNTRRVKGLPPGPIGAVTIDALKAVADPAEGDFLFFVTGDDGTTYFSRTLAEHEAAVDAHCSENCRINFD